MFYNIKIDIFKVLYLEKPKLMKSLILLPAIALLSSLKTFSQETLKTDTLKQLIITGKTHPIIYGGADIGAGLAGATGLEIGLSLNYQLRRQLFTVRYVGIVNFSIKAIGSPIPLFPGVQDNGSLEETGALYGHRYVNGGHAFSFSAGLSKSTRIIKNKDNIQLPPRIEDHYVGVPFEFNMMWFKSNKRRYRVYGLIPVGKPTGFGSSIGFKLGGNISKYSYLSLGLTSSLGYHKQY